MSHHAPEPSATPGSWPPPGTTLQPWTAPGAPVAVPRQGSRRGVVIVAVVVCALVGAFGTAAYLRLRPTGGTTVNAAASPTASPTVMVPPTTPPFAGDLRTLLLPKPASAKTQNPSPSANGDVSLEQAVEHFGNSMAIQSTLRELAFARGVTVAWLDTKGYLLVIDLYQFDTPAHTAKWAVAEQQAFAASDELETSASFDGIPGGQVFVDKKKQGVKQQMYALFHRGTIWVIMTVFYPTKPDVNVLTALATSQYQRLPAE